MAAGEEIRSIRSAALCTGGGHFGLEFPKIHEPAQLRFRGSVEFGRPHPACVKPPFIMISCENIVLF